MNLEIVGGLCPPDRLYPFDSGNIAIRETSSSESPVTISQESELDCHAWRILCKSGYAYEFTTPVPFREGVKMWILSRYFQGREAALEDLRLPGVLLHEEQDKLSDTNYLLVFQEQANVIRDRWAEQAYGNAMEFAKHASWEKALGLAEQAWVLGRGPLVDHWALLALCYQRVGRNKRAEGVLQIARRSYGSKMDGLKNKIAEFSEKWP